MTTILEHAGGFENSFMDIANDLNNEDDIEVNIVTMDDQFTKRLGYIMSFYFRENLNKNPLHRETSNSVKKRLGSVRYKKCKNFADLKKQLSESDLIYSKNEILESLILKFLIKYKNLKNVVFICGTTLFYPNPSTLNFKLHNYLYTGKIYKMLTKNVNQFHVKNSSDYQIIKKFGSNYDVKTIFNSFNIRDFQKFQVQDDFRIYDMEAYNIVWIGRLEEQKGIDRLYEIIKQVNDKYIDNRIVWNIFGDGTQREFVEKIERENANVHYYGQVANRFMSSVLKQSDLFISTSKAESFGNTILEANAAGLKALSFNIPGPQDIILNNYNGVLINCISDYVDKVIEFAKTGKVDKNNFNDYLYQNFSKKNINKKRISYLKAIVDNDEYEKNKK